MNARQNEIDIIRLSAVAEVSVANRRAKLFKVEEERPLEETWSKKLLRNEKGKMERNVLRTTEVFFLY